MSDEWAKIVNRTSELFNTTAAQSTTMWVIGFAVVAILGLFFVFIVYPALLGNSTVTVMRAKNAFKTYGLVTDLTPLACPTDDDTRLCDYYIASSAYSIFPSTYTFDFVSDSIIPLVVKAGARLIELDVYAGENDKPVVGLKNEDVGYDYAKNSISFESCCVSLGNSAFNKVDTPLSSDPFILSIVFHTDKRTVHDACAEILKSTLQRYMLGPEYAYHRKNLAQEPICNLAGKLIIVSGGNMKGSLFEEIVNLSWSTSNLRRLTYMQASQPYDHEELIESNRKHITMVVPEPVPDLKNNNPTILFGYGCQWNLVNYGSLDSMMELYVGEFQQGSIVLKPEHLRYTPIQAKIPAIPDPSISFQPMSHTSPIYDSNPRTGNKSIVI
jgi:hypothetical protein